MNILLNPSRESWPAFWKRPAFDSSGLENAVSEILNNVRIKGDSALRSYSEVFDGVSVQEFRVSVAEISEASSYVREDLKKAMQLAKLNIEKFHKAQIIDEQPVETAPGVKCWRKSVPVENVGLYIPGGSAPLFSTVLMLVIPAKIAGCRKIAICTPPSKNGKVSPLILYAALITGVADVYRLGGAQAIAAMAYGTESIPKVDKIFGPGNRFVTKAKEMVQLNGIPIDMPAGPSEVIVIAGKTSDPSFVAADLLSQAEHGADSQVILLTDDQDLLFKVKNETESQVKYLPRKEIVLKSLANSLLILLDSLDDCIEFSNGYAPEHLIISTSDPSELAGRVANAGSVFLGKYSCESAGDYATGTNHTLPTNGFARNYSGVSVESFIKRISFQEVTGEGLGIIGPYVELMAEAESLIGHRNAVALRLKSLKND
jgi:histidinol dehydrogenase